MPTLGQQVLTIQDWAKRSDPDGKIADIAEVLSQTNEMLSDMMFMEGNLPIGHQITQRTGLPRTYWRKINQPVPTSKSTTAQVVEQVGMLEAWSQVDKDEAELGGDLNAFRFSEAKPFIESMNQSMQEQVIYGSAANAERFIGFSSRYNDLSAVNAKNIIDAGGVGSVNTSIWMIVWGAETVFGIFPKGSKAGLYHKDLGLTVHQSSTDEGAPSLMEVYREHYQWKAGIALKDWRGAARACNIDTDLLVANAGAQVELTNLLIKLRARVKRHLKLGKAAIYMNETVFEMLDIQRRDAVQVGGQLKYEVVDGEEVPTFRSIPIRIIDRLLNTEERVV